jgi:hypothetical protein
MFSLGIVFLVFTSTFFSFPLTVRIIFIYTTIIMVAIFIHTILITASVNYNSFKLYPIMNSLFISYSKHYNYTSGETKLKESISIYY